MHGTINIKFIDYIGSLKWGGILLTAVLGYVFIYVKMKY